MCVLYSDIFSFLVENEFLFLNLTALVVGNNSYFNFFLKLFLYCFINFSLYLKSSLKFEILKLQIS